MEETGAVLVELNKETDCAKELYEKHINKRKAIGEKPFSKDEILFAIASVSSAWEEGVGVTRAGVRNAAQNLLDEKPQYKVALISICLTWEEVLPRTINTPQATQLRFNDDGKIL